MLTRSSEWICIRCAIRVYLRIQLHKEVQKMVQILRPWQGRLHLGRLDACNGVWETGASRHQGAQFRTPSKQVVHHSSIVPRGMKGDPQFCPIMPRGISRATDVNFSSLVALQKSTNFQFSAFESIKKISRLSLPTFNCKSASNFRLSVQYVQNTRYNFMGVN